MQEGCEPRRLGDRLVESPREAGGGNTSRRPSAIRHEPSQVAVDQHMAASEPTGRVEGGADSSPEKRERSAWARSTLSYSGSSRTGAASPGRPARRLRRPRACARSRPATAGAARRDRRARPRSRQPGPRRDVCRRRRAERLQVAEDEVVDRRRRGERTPEPASAVVTVTWCERPRSPRGGTCTSARWLRHA